MRIAKTNLERGRCPWVGVAGRESGIACKAAGHSSSAAGIQHGPLQSKRHGVQRLERDGPRVQGGRQRGLRDGKGAGATSRRQGSRDGDGASAWRPGSMPSSASSGSSFLCCTLVFVLAVVGPADAAWRVGAGGSRRGELWPQSAE